MDSQEPPTDQVFSEHLAKVVEPALFPSAAGSDYLQWYLVVLQRLVISIDLQARMHPSRNARHDEVVLSAKRDGDAIHRASNAIRQLEELLPLTEPQLRRLLETVTPNMTATTRQRVVDLLMRSDEGKAWLAAQEKSTERIITVVKTLGAGTKMLKKLQALQPASQAAVLRMTTSSREPQECLFDVGLTLDPESPFTFARPCTSTESKNLLTQLTEIVEKLEMERRNPKTKRKEKIKRVLRIQEAGGFAQGKETAYDFDYLVVLNEITPPLYALDSDEVRGKVNVLMMPKLRLAGVILEKDDSSRTHIRKPNQHQLDENTRENNFVGLAGFRIGIRSNTGIIRALDLAFAFRDGAGAASIAWTSAPSFSDSLQRLAHKAGLHYTPHGIYEYDAVNHKLGPIRPAENEVAVFKEIGIPAIPPNLRHSDLGRQWHLLPDGRYLAEKDWRSWAIDRRARTPKFEARDPVFAFTDEERLATAARLDVQRKGRRSKAQREISADPERLAEQAQRELEDAFKKFLARRKCADLSQATLPERTEGVPKKRSEPKTTPSNKSPPRKRSGPESTRTLSRADQSTTAKRRRIGGLSAMAMTPNTASVMAPGSTLTASSLTAPTTGATALLEEGRANRSSRRSRGESGSSGFGRERGSDSFETLLAEGTRAKRAKVKICSSSGEIELDWTSDLLSFREGQYLTVDSLAAILSLAKEGLEENSVGGRSIFVHQNPNLYSMKTTNDLLKNDLSTVDLFRYDLAFFPLHRGSPSTGHFFDCALAFPGRLLHPDGPPAVLLVCDSSPTCMDAEPSRPSNSADLEWTATEWSPDAAVLRIKRILSSVSTPPLSEQEIDQRLEVRAYADVPVQKSGPECAFHVVDHLETLAKDLDQAVQATVANTSAEVPIANHSSAWKAIWDPLRGDGLRAKWREKLTGYMV